MQEAEAEEESDGDGFSLIANLQPI